MTSNPEVRINLAWLLFYRESKLLAGDYELESEEQFRKWTDNYRHAWRKHETKIMSAMQECLGVSFYRQVLDVSCAPFFRPKSDPLILNYSYESDQFVDILTHELCHVLLTDNNVLQLNNDKNKVDLGKVWRGLFGKLHDFDTLVHIPVHAVLEYIYRDVLKEPKRLSRDVKMAKSYKKDGEPYVKAWNYVEERGYKKIIDDLNKSYQELQK